MLSPTATKRSTEFKTIDLKPAFEPALFFLPTKKGAGAPFLSFASILYD